MSFEAPERRPFLPRTQALQPHELPHAEQRVPHPNEFQRFSGERPVPYERKAPGWKSRLAAAALAFGGTSFTERMSPGQQEAPVAHSPEEKTRTIMDVWGTHQEPLRNEHKDDMTRADGVGRSARAEERRRYVWEHTTKLTNPEEVLERRETRNGRGAVVGETITPHQERARTTVESPLGKPYADLLRASAWKEERRLFEKSDTQHEAREEMSQEELDVRIDGAVAQAIYAATVEARRQGMKGINTHEAEYVVMEDLARLFRERFQQRPASLHETSAYFEALRGRGDALAAFTRSIESSQGRGMPNMHQHDLLSVIGREQFFALTDAARLEYLADRDLAPPAYVNAAMSADPEWFIQHRQAIRQNATSRRTVAEVLMGRIDSAYRAQAYERATSDERLLRYLRS